MLYCVAVFLCVLSLSCVVCAFYLSVQLRQSRLRVNALLEEKAKLLEEIDQYAECAKNPLGPLFKQDETPLIISFDKKGNITDVNSTVMQKFGYTKRQLIGHNIVGRILPASQETTDIISRLFKNPALFMDTETEAQTKTGEKIWISWTNKVNCSADGKVCSVDAVGFDITKRKEMEAQLQYLSSIDPQTGVLNRHALLETGTTELKRAKRYHRELSVVALKFINSDKTKTVTDSQLKDVVSLTRQVVRSVDYLGRVGDTEFILVLPETVSDNVPFLVQRLNQSLDHYNKKNRGDLCMLYAAVSHSKKEETIDDLIAVALRRVSQQMKRKYS